MRQKRRGAALALLLVVPAGACTFGGLADYEVEKCDPAATQSGDICDRLNEDPSTCTPYQCDAATSRCIERDRDDDRDGDAPVDCGGGDCDDQDAQRSSLAAEECDELDNNCNEVIDEDVIGAGEPRTIATTGELDDHADPSFAPVADGFLTTVVDASNQGSCLSLIPLNPESTGPLSTGCSLLSNSVTLAPRQPFTTPVRAGYGAAFVTTTGCAGGFLSYVFQSTTARQVDLACDAAHPAALPSVGLLPASGNKAPGILSWYETTVASRADPLGDCEAAMPAAFALAYQPDLSAPVAITSRLLSTKTTSTRPAALFTLADPAGILVASPVESDVGLWLLTAAQLASDAALPDPTRIPDLADARSVALAMGEAGATTPIAVVAERGCFGEQSLTLALGSLEDGELSFETSIEVESGAAVLTQPSLTWVAGRGGEWWVSWIDDRPGARLRRYSAEGIAIGDVVDLGRNLLRGQIATSDPASSMFYAFDAATSGGSFVEIPVGCEE